MYNQSDLEDHFCLADLGHLIFPTSEEGVRLLKFNLCTSELLVSL